MRSRTVGVRTTLMRNGRGRRSGKPVKGHAIVERVFLVGTRSADHIRASGHSGRIAMEASLRAKTGRIHGCTRTLRKTSDSSCTAGAVHTWPLTAAMTDVCRGSFRGHSSRSSHKMARQKLPRSVILPGSIDALRKVHSITSSARVSSADGTVTLSAFAVLRLITSSNVVGCSTGRSVGLTPRRTLATWRAI